MYKLYLILALTCSTLLADSQEKSTAEPKEKKMSQLDETLAPHVYMSEKRFIFESIIISLLHSNNRSYLVFDLEVERDSTYPLKRQEEEIPLVIDTIISDLTPTLGLFWNGKTEGLRPGLEKRIATILNNKFKWANAIHVTNVRVQASNITSQ
jgi:hypothetical protein